MPLETTSPPDLPEIAFRTDDLAFDVLRWLTIRETEVLRAVALGSSAKQIAKAFNIAPRTVERHIDHIRLKTRARNRAHMVALALELGLDEAV